MEAIPAADELQLPPDTESDNAVVAPGQTAVAPLIAGGVPGNGFTVIVRATVFVPQVLLIV